MDNSLVVHLEGTNEELLLGYVYTRPDQNRSELNRIGSAFVYMELFGTGPGVYTGPFWNPSGTDPTLDLQNSGSSFGSVPGPVPERSCVNRRPIRSDFRIGSIWNWSRVNIALVTPANARYCCLIHQASPQKINPVRNALF